MVSSSLSPQTQYHLRILIQQTTGFSAQNSNVPHFIPSQRQLAPVVHTCNLSHGAGGWRVPGQLGQHDSTCHKINKIKIKIKPKSSPGSARSSMITVQLSLCLTPAFLKLVKHIAISVFCHCDKIHETMNLQRGKKFQLFQ